MDPASFGQVEARSPGPGEQRRPAGIGRRFDPHIDGDRHNCTRRREGRRQRPPEPVAGLTADKAEGRRQTDQCEDAQGPGVLRRHDAGRPARPQPANSTGNPGQMLSPERPRRRFRRCRTVLQARQRTVPETACPLDLAVRGFARRRAEPPCGPPDHPSERGRQRREHGRMGPAVQPGQRVAQRQKQEGPENCLTRPEGRPERLADQHQARLQARPREPAAEAHPPPSGPRSHSGSRSSARSSSKVGRARTTSNRPPRTSTSGTSGRPL